MDFTFIALKKMLDVPQNKTIRLVLMSATLNSEEFAKYFSIHSKDNSFLIPQISYHMERKTKGKKRQNKKKVEKLKVDIYYDRKNYK